MLIPPPEVRRTRRGPPPPMVPTRVSSSLRPITVTGTSVSIPPPLVCASTEAPTFVGTLRGYQREGLGWLAFLQRFGFGGCLADDMGLGKTVMVLALLDLRLPAQRVGRPLRIPRGAAATFHQRAPLAEALLGLGETALARVQLRQQRFPFGRILPPPRRALRLPPHPRRTERGRPRRRRPSRVR